MAQYIPKVCLEHVQPSLKSAQPRNAVGRNKLLTVVVDIYYAIHVIHVCLNGMDFILYVLSILLT